MTDTFALTQEWNAALAEAHDLREEADQFWRSWHTNPPLAERAAELWEKSALVLESVSVPQGDEQAQRDEAAKARYIAATMRDFAVRVRSGEPLDDLIERAETAVLIALRDKFTDTSVPR